MTGPARRYLVHVLAASAVAAVVLTGCGSASIEDCPRAIRADLSDVASDDGSLPFRFPLDDIETHPREAAFCEPSRPFPPDKFHAAEDYHRPAGTPVYAMADGDISFSGPMRGYGWLIIVDHPQANLYSLYGHLSPTIFQSFVSTGMTIMPLDTNDRRRGSVFSHSPTQVPLVHSATRRSTSSPNSSSPAGGSSSE